jgi:hypothetical protein
MAGKGERKSDTLWVICPWCGEEIKVDKSGVYCPRCQNELYPKCWHCKSILPKSPLEKFCVVCGRQVVKEWRWWFPWEWPCFNDKEPYAPSPEEVASLPSKKKPKTTVPVPDPDPAVTPTPLPVLPLEPEAPQQKKWYKRWWVITIVVLALLIGLFFGAGQMSGGRSDHHPPYQDYPIKK